MSQTRELTTGQEPGTITMSTRMCATRHWPSNVRRTPARSAVQIADYAQLRVPSSDAQINLFWESPGKREKTQP